MESSSASVASRVIGLMCGVSVLISVACSQPAPPPAPPQAPPPAPAMVAPKLSLNAVMVAVVDHAAHGIWNVDAKPPKTDQEWGELEEHAIQLASAATLISISGTGPSDAG
jgi:hypothetical protein